MKLFRSKITLLLIGLIVIYLLGPTPKTPQLEKPLPEVPTNFEALQQFVADKEAQIGNLRPDNESRIEFAGSIPTKTPYSVLYLHGFGAVAEEGAPFHRRVAKELGANLYLPRLFGHGLVEEEPMLDFNADDYLDSAREALAVAKTLGEKVIILATSNGATLSLILGNDPDVAALGLYSPNIKIKDPRAFLLTYPWGLYLARLITGSKYHFMGDMTSEKENFNTTFYRFEATIEVQNLLEVAMHAKTFEKIKIPVFMGYYYKNEEEQDDTVRVEDMIDMFGQLGTVDNQKKKVAFPEAKSHVITSYLSTTVYDKVAQETLSFLKEQLPITKQDSLHLQ